MEKREREKGGEGSVVHIHITRGSRPEMAPRRRIFSPSLGSPRKEARSRSPEGMRFAQR